METESAPCLGAMLDWQTGNLEAIDNKATLTAFGCLQSQPLEGVLFELTPKVLNYPVEHEIFFKIFFNRVACTGLP